MLKTVVGMLVALCVVGCGDANPFADEDVRIVRGINGVDGERGPVGERGETVVGPKGERGESIVGPRGERGEVGPVGPTGEAVIGPQGERGPSGVDGVDGKDANSTVIDPCGDTVGIIDEVLLVMPDNKILGSFSDTVEGRNTRFVLIPDGTYMTTDGSSCVFTVREGKVL
jgi:hypothetical protein